MYQEYASIKYANKNELSRSMANLWLTVTSSKMAIWNTSQIVSPKQ